MGGVTCFLKKENNNTRPRPCPSHRRRPIGTEQLKWCNCLLALTPFHNLSHLLTGEKREEKCSVSITLTAAVLFSPPDTGASMKTAPIFSAASAISLLTAGSMVEESMRRVPFFTFLQQHRAEDKEEVAEEEEGKRRRTSTRTLIYKNKLESIYIFTKS